MTTGAQRTLLIACAVDAEARAVARGLGVELAEGLPRWAPLPLSERAHVLVTGVGKANACGSVSRALAGGGYRAVWSAGVAGALPGSGLSIGDTVGATSCVFADEGVGTPEGFLPIARVGFPVTDGLESSALAGEDAIACTDELPARAGVAADADGADRDGLDGVGSGRARECGRRADGCGGGGDGGAGVALAGAHAGVVFSELRAISNTTGDRGSQVWDLKAALAALEGLFSTMG